MKLFSKLLLLSAQRLKIRFRYCFSNDRKHLVSPNTVVTLSAAAAGRFLQSEKRQAVNPQQPVTHWEDEDREGGGACPEASSHALPHIQNSDEPENKSLRRFLNESDNIYYYYYHY